MPIPLSRTSMRTAPRPALSTALTAMRTSPRSVNLTALPIRLSAICRTRVGSPRMKRGSSGSMSSRTSTPFSTARSTIESTVPSSSATASKSTLSNSRCPASIFEKSRMSLISASSASPLERAISANSRCWTSRCVSSSRPVMPITPLRGVRISWLMVARKALLARLPASAASRAARDASAWRAATLGYVGLDQDVALGRAARIQ